MPDVHDDHQGLTADSGHKDGAEHKDGGEQGHPDKQTVDEHIAAASVHLDTAAGHLEAAQDKSGSPHADIHLDAASTLAKAAADHVNLAADRIEVHDNLVAAKTTPAAPSVHVSPAPEVTPGKVRYVSGTTAGPVSQSGGLSPGLIFLAVAAIAVGAYFAAKHFGLV